MRLDALIQATLDPSVLRIEYIPSCPVRGLVVPLSAIVVCGETTRHILDLPDEGPPPDFDQEGLRLLAFELLGLPVATRTGADVAKQPLAGNARLAWRSRAFRVPADDRVRILAHLEETSPARLVEVAALVRGSADGVATVLALACQDLLEIDLASAPLGPWTAVRRRRRRDQG